MTLLTQAQNGLFDLDPWAGQRESTFNFELINGVSGLVIAELHPSRDNPPTLSHDTTRTIKRTLGPLVLDETDTALVDSVNNRVRVSMIIGEHTYPLGRYVFMDHTRIRTTRGHASTSVLGDEMFIVDQKIERGFSCRTQDIAGVVVSGEVVESAITRLVFELPVVFTAEPTAFGSIGSWPQGTNRGRILDDLALDGDYFSPWFGNDYEMHVIRSFDPADRVPAFDWDANDVVMRDTITETSDLIDAANRIVVVSNTPSAIGTSTLPVVGVYNIPSSAPHSLLNRGFVITDVRELQLTHQSQAIAIAANIGQRGTVFERTELSTALDPRHDSYDIIRWQGENWLELAWSLVLREGSDMRHVIRKAYR